MKVKLLNCDVVDCTADPHVINIRGIDTLLEIVKRVCESDLVFGINVVHVAIGDTKYQTRYYSDWGNGIDSMSGENAAKDKIHGLYLRSREEGEKYNLPAGLSGVKRGIQLIREAMKDGVPVTDMQFAVGVMWRAFMAHKCSDYIYIGLEKGVIDFSNQDDYMDSENYGDHLKN